MPDRRVSLEAWLTRQWQQVGLYTALTWPLHALMKALVAWRRALFRSGALRATALPVPVVVVGNRIAGGAGKTPTTLALLEHLKAQGWHPGLLTRGHGGTASRSPDALVLDANSAPGLNAGITGDEPWLLWQRTGVPVAVCAQRARGGRALLARHPELDVLVCDDGLQHLALARDLEIVVFDERGAGNGCLLPAGPLREPLSSPSGARDGQPPLVLYNAERATTALPGHLAQRQLRQPLPWARWREGGTDGHNAPTLAPSDTHAETTWAAAGIAQPERFFRALQALGHRFQPLPLPDHAELEPLPWPPEARHVILTEKDAVKLSPEALARHSPHTQVWVCPLDFSPEPAFWQALDARLAPHHPGRKRTT
jgi:tetraacyldisaccharide 4'-kinase